MTLAPSGMKPAPDDGPPQAPEAEASRFEELLLAAALLFYAVALPLGWSLFRPGYCLYDEEGTLDQIQAWREGGPLIFRFGWASLYRGLCILLVGLGGPHLTLVHLPALLAVLLESLLLYLWLKGKLGARAALWASLANLVCTATFARGASLLGGALLPALFLSQALLLEKVRRPWAAALWGLAAGLTLLDYEGWVGALLFLLPYAGWLWRKRGALALAGALGLGLGLLIVVSLSPDLAAHLLSRGAHSAPGQGFLSQAWFNARSLLSQGDRFVFSAAPYHPWPAPWTWPLALLGLFSALRRFPWLAWLLACGGLPLGLADTNMEPHRLCLALLAVGALAGAGAAVAWRRPWGAALCVALLAYGAVDEARAWAKAPREKLVPVYSSSLTLEAAVDWLAGHRPPGGWEVISGLGPSHDGDFRFLLDQAGVPTQGRTPVALVPWDYTPALKGLKAAGPGIVVGDYHPVHLFFPSRDSALRLEAVSASLKDLRYDQIHASPGQAVQDAARWLQDPSHKDPWARTVAWELWLDDGLLNRNVELGGLSQMSTEPLVCGWAPDAAAAELEKTGRPDLAKLLRAKAESVDPRRRFLDADRRIARF